MRLRFHKLISVETRHTERREWSGHAQMPGSLQLSTANSGKIRQFGTHGDINPGNILWFQEGKELSGNLTGTLKISDFGQAELTTAASKTMAHEVANTLTYRPPECDLLAARVRPTYDIWCLGCVYLELLTWQLGGNELIYDFAQRRAMPDLYQNGIVTDTFFQLEKQDESAKVRVKVKDAITKASMRIRLAHSID